MLLTEFELRVYQVEADIIEMTKIEIFGPIWLFFDRDSLRLHTTAAARVEAPFY